MLELSHTNLCEHILQISSQLCIQGALLKSAVLGRSICITKIDKGCKSGLFCVFVFLFLFLESWLANTHLQKGINLFIAFVILVAMLFFKEF